MRFAVTSLVLRLDEFAATVSNRGLGVHVNVNCKSQSRPFKKRFLVSRAHWAAQFL